MFTFTRARKDHERSFLGKRLSSLAFYFALLKTEMTIIEIKYNKSIVLFFIFMSKNNYLEEMSVSILTAYLKINKNAISY